MLVPSQAQSSQHGEPMHQSSIYKATKIVLMCHSCTKRPKWWFLRTPLKTTCFLSLTTGRFSARASSLRAMNKKMTTCKLRLACDILARVLWKCRRHWTTCVCSAENTCATSALQMICKTSRRTSSTLKITFKRKRRQRLMKVSYPPNVR